MGGAGALCCHITPHPTREAAAPTMIPPGLPSLRGPSRQKLRLQGGSAPLGAPQGGLHGAELAPQPSNCCFPHFFLASDRAQSDTVRRSGTYRTLLGRGQTWPDVVKTHGGTQSGCGLGAIGMRFGRGQNAVATRSGCRWTHMRPQVLARSSASCCSRGPTAASVRKTGAGGGRRGVLL